MKTKSRIASALLVAALLTVAGVRAWAAANVPVGLSYSGLLRNGGTPESGAQTHNFVFELFDGNATVCTDTRSGLSVTDGRFDVSGLFAGNGCTLDAHLASKPALSIRMTVDGTLLTPPQPIGTVPYAARARVAERTEAEPVTGWVTFDGSGACTPCQIFDSHNVTSVSRVSAGAYLITWTAPFASTRYVVTGACQRTDADATLSFQIGRGLTTNPFTASTAQVGCGNYNGVGLDSALVNVMAVGR